MGMHVIMLTNTQERVQSGSVTRYQKWFSSQFLSSPGSDALVPDLVRYICAVYHPSNQILSSKVTPRYHILGWLYLLWCVVAFGVCSWCCS
jgi:integrator complex subunit 3